MNIPKLNNFVKRLAGLFFLHTIEYIETTTFAPLTMSFDILESLFLLLFLHCIDSLILLEVDEILFSEQQINIFSIEQVLLCKIEC